MNSNAEIIYPKFYKPYMVHTSSCQNKPTIMYSFHKLCVY
jgi:hypothetical protein